MNLSKLHKKLIAVAKNAPFNDHVPYAFEQRIMHRLASLTPPSPWALWGGPLWRGAVSCMAITILCGVWSVTHNRQTDSQESFSQAFEAAVFAPPAQHAEDALVSPWKVILATMVIFGCGVVTGGLLMRTVIPPPLAPVEVAAHPVVTTTNQPPPLGQYQRPEFLRRIQKQLDLSQSQNEEIAKIMKDSQERTRKFWEQISPQLREEFKDVRSQIRQVLTPEQRKKWDDLLKTRPRKLEGSNAPNARPPRSPSETQGRTNSL